MDRTYFAETENWKHCNKIIFKCINSTVGPIFNEKVAVCPPKTHAATEKEKKKRENAGNATCIQMDTRGLFGYNLFLLKLKMKIL